jgi:hypothetical protein
MSDTDHRDPLGVEEDREKRRGEARDTAGPNVAQMATTYGSSFIGSEDEAEALASDETDSGVGSEDGLGTPRPIQEGQGR